MTIYSAYRLATTRGDLVGVSEDDGFLMRCLTAHLSGLQAAGAGILCIETGGVRASNVDRARDEALAGNWLHNSHVKVWGVSEAPVIP